MANLEQVRSRRQILASIGSVSTVLLAGCSALEQDSDKDGKTDINDDYPDDSSRSRQIEDKTNTAVFNTNYRFYEGFIQTGFVYDFTLEELNDRKFNVTFYTASEYEKLVTRGFGEPFRTELQTSKVEGSLHVPNDFDNGHPDGVGILLARANTEPELLRVNYSMERYW